MPLSSRFFSCAVILVPQRFGRGVETPATIQGVVLAGSTPLPKRIVIELILCGFGHKGHMRHIDTTPLKSASQSFFTLALSQSVG